MIYAQLQASQKTPGSVNVGASPKVINHCLFLIFQVNTYRLVHHTCPDDLVVAGRLFLESSCVAEIDIT